MGCKRQGATLSMLKFREILRLHELGHNKSEIARSCLVARSTVRDYLQRAQSQALNCAKLNRLSDSELLTLLGKGQQRKTLDQPAIDFETIHRELNRKGVTLCRLWLEGKERGDWQYSYSGFCRRYRNWRAQQNLSMRQVYTGGDKLFVDYCGVTVPVKNPKSGSVTAAQIFVACLGASNYTYTEAVPTQSIENWIGAHQRALAFFGGVPVAIVPDNLKSGITDPCRYEPGVNRSYQDFAEHYGVVILPARPKAPRDKAKVEKAVQEVERQVLAPLRDEVFTSFSTLNQALQHHLESLNNRTMRSYGLSRRALFEQVDQPELKPLPTQVFEYARWKRAKVNLDYHIEVDRHYYSVPYEYVRKGVEVKVTESLVVIFYDHQRIAIHERCRIPCRHSTQDEHMPPEHWEYKHQSREKFLLWASQVGPATVRQVQTIFEHKEHEEQAFRTLRGLQHLNTSYGRERLEAACSRANALGMVGQRHIRTMLKTGIESAPLPVAPPQVVPMLHPNVRGALYYQAQ